MRNWLREKLGINALERIAVCNHKEIETLKKRCRRKPLRRDELERKAKANRKYGSFA